MNRVSVEAIRVGNEPQLGRLLRMSEVEWLTGIKKTAIDVAIKAGRFPTPVKISSRAIGFREEQIRAWMASLQPVTTK